MILSREAVGEREKEREGERERRVGVKDGGERFRTG